MTTRTRRPRQTPEQRAAKVAELTDKLNTAIAELTSDEQWTAMLATAARFHRYSFRNVMLLLAQAEERGTTIRRVAGLHTWGEPTLEQFAQDASSTSLTTMHLSPPKSDGAECMAMAPAS